jgi:hypothetical protein
MLYHPDRYSKLFTVHTEFVLCNWYNYVFSLTNIFGKESLSWDKEHNLSLK